MILRFCLFANEISFYKLIYRLHNQIQIEAESSWGSCAGQQFLYYLTNILRQYFFNNVLGFFFLFFIINSRISSVSFTLLAPVAHLLLMSTQSSLMGAILPRLGNPCSHFYHYIEPVFMNSFFLCLYLYNFIYHYQTHF